MENMVIERKWEMTGWGEEKIQFYLQSSCMLCNNLFVWWIGKSSNKMSLFVVIYATSDKRYEISIVA